MTGDPVAHVRIAIVGTGFAGIGMAVALKQAGYDDFVIFERADDVGGTWRDNTYPGCACDVPSHLYSFSFAPNPEWSNTFSPQPEIWDYLRRVAKDYDVVSHVRYDHEVTGAAWDHERNVWEVETVSGRYRADILISGMGALSEPSIPAVPGLETFEGTTFHSATWRHDHDLSGERVAVIGTGASAIQFVPQIQPAVAELQLYQRTPPWIVPRRARPLTSAERRLYRTVPALQQAMRTAIYWAREAGVVGFVRNPRVMKVAELAAKKHLHSQVPDDELRAKLTPDYTIGCKRILLSNDYYPSLAQPNVDVITSGIAEVRPRSIVTTDGVEREVDTIIFGTGFHVTDMPAADLIRGRGGRLLDEKWHGSPEAYRGTTVSDFPNFFMLVGPNTGLGHSSMVFMIESQVAYVMDALRFMDAEGYATVEVREDAERRFNDDVQQRMRNTVWTSGGCVSWYLDETGKNTTLWPSSTWRFRLLTRRFDPTSYVVRPKLPQRGTAAA